MKTTQRTTFVVTAYTLEQLEAALESSLRGDRTFFVAAEPVNSDLDGVGLDIVTTHKGMYSVVYFDHSNENRPEPCTLEQALKAAQGALDAVAVYAELQAAQEE